MSRNTLSAKIISLSLLFVLLFAIIAPTQAQAGVFGGLQDDIKEKLEEGFQDGSISCVAAAAVAALFSYLASALTNVPTTPVPEVIKEQIMDCVFWAIKNKIVEEITEKTVGYVQTGMNGNPAFAQNVQQYLLSVADKAAGEYIQQTTAGEFLCSPYRGEVQQALTRYYQQQSGRGPSAGSAGGGTSCTLTDVVSNIGTFTGGDFSAGGWDAWMTMYMNPYNNPYGAYIESKNELDRRVETAKEEAKAKLEQGEGYYGKEAQNCYEVPVMNQDGTNSSFTECDPPKTETPGATVKDAFEQTYGVTMDELANADELSELIVLWMSHMVTDMLTGEKGLSGYDPADFEHEVPDFEISDEDWDDIDIGPQPGGGGGGSCGTGPYVAPENSGGQGQQITFSENGIIVSEDEVGAENWVVEGTPADKRYSRIEANFNMKVGQLVETEQSQQDYNSLFWVVRGSSGRLYGGGDHWDNNVVAEVGYLLANGKIRIMHNMDHPAYGVCGITEATGAAMSTGDTFNVTLVYETDPTNPDYGVSASFDGPGDHDFSISVGNVAEFIDLDNIHESQVFSTGISFVFGPGTVSDGFQVPGGAGWEYSNLHVTISP